MDKEIERSQSKVKFRRAHKVCVYEEKMFTVGIMKKDLIQSIYIADSM